MSFFDDVSVWILDSSSLIETKKIIHAEEQQNAFRVLEDMVKKRQIAMPRQVINEVSKVQHLDIPGTWVIRVKKYLKYPVEVDHRILSIIKSECPKLTDYTKDSEDADPYVVALAYQLQKQEITHIRTDGRTYKAVSLPGLQEQEEMPCIVTEDRNDHKSQSITSACKQLNLKCTDLENFLTYINIPIRSRNLKE